MKEKRFLNNTDLEYLNSVISIQTSSLDSDFIEKDRDLNNELRKRRSKTLTKIQRELPEYLHEHLEDWMLIARAWGYLESDKKTRNRPLDRKKRSLQDSVANELLFLAEFMKSWMPRERIVEFLDYLLLLRPDPALGQDYYDPKDVIQFFSEYLGSLDFHVTAIPIKPKVEQATRLLADIRDSLKQNEFQIEPRYNEEKLPLLVQSSIESSNENEFFQSLSGNIFPIQQISAIDKSVLEDFNWINKPEKLIYERQLEGKIDLVEQSGNNIQIAPQYRINLLKAVLSSFIHKTRITDRNSIERALGGSSLNRAISTIVNELSIHPMIIYRIKGEMRNSMVDEIQTIYSRLGPGLFSLYLQGSAFDIVRNGPDPGEIIADFFIFEDTFFSIPPEERTFRRIDDSGKFVIGDDVLNAINKRLRARTFFTEVEKVVFPEKTINLLFEIKEESYTGGIKTDLKRAVRQLIEKGIIKRKDGISADSPIDLDTKLELTDHGFKTIVSDAWSGSNSIQYQALRN